ncbi:Hypothetical predicted protein [Cloeon dipterum]|uniref:Cullin-5 n=1 Tax=Cloeon dipterum TaxID=197152 RepID=A0A8S1BU11_9INSE|nr:Hypothetical predicted protein [Cloeon dipterum]
MSSSKWYRDTKNGTWSRLETVIGKILMLESVSLPDWSEALRHVYNLAVYGDDDHTDLYDEIKYIFVKHVRKLAKQIHDAETENLLNTYMFIWSEYKEVCNYLELLFLSLNENTHSVLRTGHLALQAWQKEILQPVVKKLVGLLLESATHEREGLHASNNKKLEIMRGVVNSFIGIDKESGRKSKIYDEIFEKPFLDGLSEYYKKESSKMLQEHEIVEYVEKVVVKLEEEVAWSSTILKEESIVKMKTDLIEHFIKGSEGRISSECKQMIAEQQKSKLASVYKFLKYIPGYEFKEIKTNLKNHIEKEVLASVSNLKGNDVHTTFIKNLLDYHKKYQDMVQNVFDNDPAFVAVFDQTFHHVMNHKTVKDQNISSAEMLAKRCDALLLTTKMSEGEADEELSHTFNTIFPYIDEGDEFETFYMKLLAKRLLHNTVQSMELEEKMIKIFMKTCGFGFSNKLTTMLMDIRLSADITNRFTQKNKKIGFGFAVKIPKCSVWPISQNNVLNLPLPGVIETTMHLFEGFYNENFSGRKLIWMNHLSSCEININVKRTYMVTMNTIQMAILWLFQNTDVLSFSSIKGSFGINGEILSKHISSLVKSKLLNCDTNVVGETSTLTFNVAFKKNLIKFKILGASTRVSPEEKKEVIKTLTEDRKYFLEAAVVRTMKHHKEMNHNDLVNEVFTQTKRKFTVHMPMLKKIIENLIEKDYLQRKASENDVYQYLA